MIAVNAGWRMPSAHPALLHASSKSLREGLCPAKCVVPGSTLSTEAQPQWCWQPMAEAYKAQHQLKREKNNEFKIDLHMASCPSPAAGTQILGHLTQILEKGKKAPIPTCQPGCKNPLGWSQVWSLLDWSPQASLGLSSQHSTPPRPPRTKQDMVKEENQSQKKIWNY